MSRVKLFPHQENALEITHSQNRVAYYLDMQLGLGKTFVGSEKMKQLGARTNLVVCQKSKVDDWVNHFLDNYGEYFTYDLTDEKELEKFLKWDCPNLIGVINYDLIFRRPELAELKDFTLMLDESSLIQNEMSTFILKTKMVFLLKLLKVIRMLNVLNENFENTAQCL